MIFLNLTSRQNNRQTAIVPAHNISFMLEDANGTAIYTPGGTIYVEESYPEIIDQIARGIDAGLTED